MGLCTDKHIVACLHIHCIRGMWLIHCFIPWFVLHNVYTRFHGSNIFVVYRGDHMVTLLVCSLPADV